MRFLCPDSIRGDILSHAISSSLAAHVHKGKPTLGVGVVIPVVLFYLGLSKVDLEGVAIRLRFPFKTQ